MKNLKKLFLVGLLGAGLFFNSVMAQSQDNKKKNYVHISMQSNVDKPEVYINDKYIGTVGPKTKGREFVGDFITNFNSNYIYECNEGWNGLFECPNLEIIVTKNCYKIDKTSLPVNIQVYMRLMKESTGSCECENWKDDEIRCHIKFNLDLDLNKVNSVEDKCYEEFKKVKSELEEDILDVWRRSNIKPRTVGEERKKAKEVRSVYGMIDKLREYDKKELEINPNKKKLELVDRYKCINAYFDIIINRNTMHEAMQYYDMFRKQEGDRNLEGCKRDEFNDLYDQIRSQLK